MPKIEHNIDVPSLRLACRSIGLQVKSCKVHLKRPGKQISFIERDCLATVTRRANALYELRASCRGKLHTAKKRGADGKLLDSSALVMYRVALLAEVEADFTLSAGSIALLRSKKERAKAKAEASARRRAAREAAGQPVGAEAAAG